MEKNNIDVYLILYHSGMAGEEDERALYFPE